ncbi:MAG: hypothetical protein OXI97_04315, partial [Acidimicrobiaceae bacterium]|nr:hypothetical protein [Acidimicrobiaceae bacterium]
MASCARFTIRGAHLWRLSQRQLAGFVLAFAIGAAACTSTPSETLSTTPVAPSVAAAPETSLPVPVAETQEAASVPVTIHGKVDDSTPVAEPKTPRQTAAGSPHTEYIAVSVGDSHTCAITVAGEIECWGYRADRRLDAPQGTYSAVSAGRRHSCAVSTEGEIACWGSNDYGRLESPAGTYTKVDVGLRHSCALSTEAAVVCWGGPGWLRDAHMPPGEYLDVAAGDDKTCAVSADGEMICWGEDWEYRDHSMRFVPPGQYASVAGEDGSWCGLRPTGIAKCWLDDQNRGGFRDPPVDDYAAIAMGRYSVCALSHDNRVRCWYSDGESLGVPDSSYIAVSNGCAISTAGAVECWDYYDDLRAAPPKTEFTALAADDFHTCGLTVDGAALCWGLDRYNRLNARPGEFTS